MRYKLRDQWTIGISNSIKYKVSSCVQSPLLDAKTYQYFAVSPFYFKYGGE